MSTRAANRYAKALLDLALEKKQEEVLFTDMQSVAKTITNSAELSLLLSSPAYKIADKKTALDAIFTANTGDLTSKLIGLLAENKRISLLPLIAKQYGVLYNEAKGKVKAVVTTAFPIDEALKSQVMARAEKLAKGNSILLESKVDKNIIGGFILRVGDVQIDTSIANKLNTLKSELKE